MNRLIPRKTATLLLLLVGFTTAALAQNGSLVDAGVDYNYVRTNLPAGGCGCFALNGGSGWVAFNVNRSIGIVGEIASQPPYQIVVLSLSAVIRCW